MYVTLDFRICLAGGRGVWGGGGLNAGLLVDPLIDVCPNHVFKAKSISLLPTIA